MKAYIHEPITLNAGSSGWVPLGCWHSVCPAAYETLCAPRWRVAIACTRCSCRMVGSAGCWISRLARSEGAASWCSVPVLLTLRALMEFICIPAWRFAAGDDMVDSTYVHAMLLTLIGFTAFWIASLVFMKETGLRFVPSSPNTSSRVAFMSAAMLCVGLAGNIVMWKSGLFSYTADSGLRESSFAIMQWLTFLGNLLNAALVISTIEVFGKPSARNHSLRPSSGYPLYSR